MNLAALANLALYSSMIVYTLAMLAFSWHLSARAPHVAAARLGSHEREPVLVGSSAPPSGGSTIADAAEPGFVESVKSRQRGNIALMLTYLATALLDASVLMRGLAVSRPPWGNMFEFATAAAAAIGTAYCVLAKRNDWQWLGVFIVTPVLLVLGLSVAVLYTDAGELMPALKSYWLGIHVSVAFIAVAFFTIAFAVGLLYLVRLRREQNPPARPNFIESLPSATALERTAYSVNMVGFILWTFTLIAGAIWAQKAWGSYWTWDPKEVWTFVVWVVYAAYLHARATAGWEPRKAMTIALAGYACILVNFLVVNVYFVGQHSYSGL